jgi:hypothetical protein
MRGSQKLSKLRRPKVFLPLLISLLIAVILVMAVRNLNSPAEGTVTTPLGDTSQSNLKNVPTTQTYSDELITFKYPSVYSVQDSSTTNKPYLDTITLASKSPRDKFIAISVAKEELASDSGLNYRKQHPDLYKVESSEPDSVVFSKQDGMEYTGYIAHGLNVIAVSFTSVSKADFSNGYKQIADSLSWQQ